MSQLMNCPNCGKLFVKALREVCNECHNEVEKQFQTVYQYVRKKENRMASMKEVTEATGVPERKITMWIRQGRLQIAQFPNLAYPCDSCGAPIREGKICVSCKGKLKKDLDIHEKEKRFDERKKERQYTYHTLNSRIERDRN
ncbi:TIGR03826 family flagellar region protein [Anaerobacillus sp. MEB173]|uniref:TIGR03826 family flagellar region protein n=1 Tax=Anaerobacillus sp. MEB173 TaxID=3383345 RepID=UPI003F8DEFB9